MIQFDLFASGCRWELPQKGAAFPLAQVEVEPCADGWAYAAGYMIAHGCYEGGGFGLQGGYVAPTRAEAVAAALEWIERPLRRFPKDHGAFMRWRERVQ